MHLDLHLTSFGGNLDFLYGNISDITEIRQIYHLKISGRIFADTLVIIFMILPTLDSLRISSLSVSHSESLSNEEKLYFRTILSTVRITKVNFTTMKNIEEVYFLIELCPHLIYLRVDDLNNMDMKLFVRLILMKMKTHHQSKFQLLCFHVSAADDETIKRLNNMIDDEKLLIDYTIKRALDFIYLQWNRKE
jgi:hypothetical protein